MLPMVALLSSVTLTTAPEPLTILQMKIGAIGQVFVKSIALAGFAAALPLALRLRWRRWLVPVAVTDAALPHPVESVIFEDSMELPRFANKNILCRVDPRKQLMH